MAFDQATRNRLQKFVSEARDLLQKELTRQMQHDFGMDPETGKVSEIDKLTHLDDARQETARMLRDTFDHYMAAQPFGGEKGTLDRIAREQAFTVLNRLCALRMAEARGFLIESIGSGYQSKGFQLYARLAGHSLGELGDAYQCYLFSLFDEFAVDLPVLFDRYSAMGRLFPKDTALRELLELINEPDIAQLWAEDEAIGWIYQYFNTKEERRQMRDASQAPRNSRELAVRNQFFTPRYVVEFLTDNTLGRIWYEMTQGNTALAETCQYLVRRPDEVFLSIDKGPALDWFQGEAKEEPRLTDIAHSVNGCLRAGGLDGGAQEWLEKQIGAIHGDKAESLSTQALLDALFVLHRVDQVSEGTIEKHQKEVGALTATLRQRVEESQKEDLSQQELLNQPVFIPLRPLKDPRDIKILDPACGSGHFLLYAFDLLETIYSEYWDLEDQAGLSRAEPSRELAPLKELYETKDALIADLPRLVIEYNLHGIDIDPRAVQIAGLSLWLRAHRGWQAREIKSTDRPVIQKSNIVCAEPMPGDTEMLREFSDSLKPRVLGQLVEIIFKKMELAGEAGPLLKIEEEIASAVDNAREEFNKELLRRKEEAGYLPGMAPKNGERSLFDFSDLPDKTRFWEMAEEKILGALRDYAEQVENGNNSRRRLFANDAAKGFAFIDLCRKRYDAVLMNPPFGAGSQNASNYCEKKYPSWNKNLLCCFFERELELSELIGSVFDRTASIKKTYQDFRHSIILNRNYLRNIIDLGWGVLDADVEVSAGIISSRNNNKRELFFDITQIPKGDKEASLKQSCNLIYHSELEKNSYIAKPISFLKLPNEIIGFQLPAFVRRLFEYEVQISEEYCKIFKGHDFKADQHFKLFWEIPSNKLGVFGRSDWTWVFNGGVWAPFYRPIRDVAPYGKNAKIIRENPSVLLRNLNKQGEPGIGYGKRGEFLDAQVVGKGYAYTAEGLGGEVYSEQDAFLSVSILNSKIFQYVINLYCGQHKSTTYVNLYPVPKLDTTNKSAIANHAKEIWLVKQSWQTGDETDIIFSKPRLFFTKGSALKEKIYNLNKLENESNDKIRTLTKKINEDLYLSYNLSNDDIKLIENYCSRMPLDRVWLEGPEEEAPKFYEHLDALFSFIIGCIFGRWDITKISNQKETYLPKPFDPPLPCQPATLEDNNNRSRNFVWKDILVIDEGNPEDIIARVREAIEVIWKDKAEEIEQEAIEILGVNSLREYFSRPNKFFADHLKRYSKSRRQAPIYWPLSTTSGSYTLWLYYHRLTDQTLYTCINDYVEPKIKEVTSSVNVLQAKAKRNRQEEKQLEDLSDFHQELVAFRDELLRIAKFWEPDLNDGVQITAAPLWQLFRHRPWQNKLKETWEKLEKGDYDWAHLALPIWPGRVVKTAHKDRSIAIAHDLEEALWEEVEKGRDRKGNPKYQWQPKNLSQKELDSIAQSISSTK